MVLYPIRWAERLYPNQALSGYGCPCEPGPGKEDHKMIRIEQTSLALLLLLTTCSSFIELDATKKSWPRNRSRLVDE